MRKLKSPLGITCLVILAIPLIGILANLLGDLACHTINRTKYFDEQVDIQPILDLLIPADMDVSKWTNSRANFLYQENGVESNVQRFPSSECANYMLQHWKGCFYTKTELVGQPPDQYCVSKVEEVHDFKFAHYWEPEFLIPNFCPFEGDYNSTAVFQKGDVLVEVYLTSAILGDKARDMEIQRLAQEISAAAQQGDYPRLPKGKISFDYYCAECHGMNEISESYLPYKDMREGLLDKYRWDDYKSTGDTLPAGLYEYYLSISNHAYRVTPCPFIQGQGSDISSDVFNETIRFILSNPEY